MKRLRIRIDGKDKPYLDMLREYLKVNGSGLFDIVDENADCFLTDDQSYSGKKDVIVLAEENGDIFKYQPADHIISCILEKGYKDQGSQRPLCIKKTEIIFITSAHGGAGKSTIAQGLCLYWAKHSKKVLYIDLDAFTSGECIFSNEKEKDFSILRYYISKMEGDINIYIEKYKNYDTVYDVSYLKSIYPSCENMLSEAESSYLMKGMARNELYDYIVIDPPLYPTKVYMDMMKNCDHVIFVKNAGSTKEEEVIAFLENSGVDPVIACNMVRYTKGIYIPKAQSRLELMPKEFFDAMDALSLCMEEKNGENI